jgi:hypothetical protein
MLDNWRLKGQYHEIFDPPFLDQSNQSNPPRLLTKGLPINHGPIGGLDL